MRTIIRIVTFTATVLTAVVAYLTWKDSHAEFVLRQSKPAGATVTVIASTESSPKDENHARTTEESKDARVRKTAFASVLGPWHQPYLQRNLEIEPVGGSQNRFVVRDVSGSSPQSIGFGTITGDDVLIQVRVVKNDGQRDVELFADLKLSLEEQGRLLVGTAHGPDVREPNDIMWERGHK
jgi:hypothetical protein